VALAKKRLNGCKIITSSMNLLIPKKIHIFQYTPQIQLSKLINNLKTVSSRYLKKEFPERFSRFYWKDALWSGSYFISSCGGVTVEVLKKYVQEQNRPD